MLSRQEETVAQVENGEVTKEQFERQTGYNDALGFCQSWIDDNHRLSGKCFDGGRRFSNANRNRRGF
jgi:hypothetical protein